MWQRYRFLCCGCGTNPAAANERERDDDVKVVHGDVKASNVLLDAAMSAKLCDFGGSGSLILTIYAGQVNMMRADGEHINEITGCV
ncbi:hypothetical protein E2562_034564 [Oryza meyeriana var. granulata]|uniref:Protein kinase domain-containing protein n=1 Tax=Oryza meyeriana var. granulata TaxID=110450 RepID=A0A6G1CX02_9ORYZ|nr:hypothetical protein E2562_034564 [Oryza meyeriana var. granulata]